MTGDLQRTIDAVWRIESAALIAGLTRITRDVGLAEDLAQDALLAALEQWPASGVPQKPGAWLMTVARRRAIDGRRRAPMLDRSHAELGRDRDRSQEDALLAFHDALDDDLGDDVLRLLFMACHPVLAVEARAALTLRLFGHLGTADIARAFLTRESTMAQRIVRAKRTLAEARVDFAMPHGAERAERLASVLEVIYLVFNEGYSATSGDDWMRPSLCEEAMRLGRILAARAPGDPDVHALLALMELHASRAAARTDRDGNPVLLLEQDRARWDRLLIQRGLASLERALRLGGALGPYALQAGIVACHARARTAVETDWVKIVALYDALAQVMPSPVVELNRAVAVSMAFGAAEALPLVEALAEHRLLDGYHLLPSVRADLLQRVGRFDEARHEFERAASMTRNTRERELLRRRAAECATGG